MGEDATMTHECPTCMGSGFEQVPDERKGEMRACRDCKGKGYIGKPPSDGEMIDWENAGQAYSDVEGGL